ncbi:helix-turn-helix domain-containing protein [Robertkochia solimangrovi]|uniref:helix-turn-helix domain-containing protein n=1 Tax=Robertkochia solimangrovi TaxID=2213046 RepID=UPI00118008A7|nr:AraC family transcriptional regulator [Robertkochia solimangrovi]TRZ41300.1 AraC family transcriptional regulator [Robertkochia solimangrovi]
MRQIENTSIEDFYKEIAENTGIEVNDLLPPDINKNIGHFNVFKIADMIREVKQTKRMPYNRRSYYKISLIRGKNRAEYADKVIEIETNALLFATPRVPYHYYALEEDQEGSFCVFTADFLSGRNTSIVPDDYPIFQTGGAPIFEISETQTMELQSIFEKMQKEIITDYPFKYDLIRNYVMELIHYGQKLQPAPVLQGSPNASKRIISLFIELLERQFPIESPAQRLGLRTAGDYAERLAIHVNHLNRILKENTGRTTTEIINNRILQEAKILLKQTDWNVSEIAYGLGFEEVAHFSNFFKKRAAITPVSFRS